MSVRMRKKAKAWLSGFFALIILLNGLPFLPSTAPGKAYASTDMRIEPSEINTSKGEKATIIFNFTNADDGQGVHPTDINVCTVKPDGRPELGALIKHGEYQTKNAQGEYIVHQVEWDGTAGGQMLPEGRYTICITPSGFNGDGTYYGQTASFEIINTTKPKAPKALTIEPASSGASIVRGVAEPDTTVTLEVGYSEGDVRELKTDIPVNSQGQWETSVQLAPGAIAHIGAQALRDGLKSSYSELLQVMNMPLPAFPITWEQLAGYYYKANTIDEMVTKAKEIAALNKVTANVCPTDLKCDVPVIGVSSLLLEKPLQSSAIAQADLAKFQASAIAKRLHIVNPSGQSPIDAARGDFAFRDQEISLPALVPIQFGLTYLSRDSYTGAIGSGWRHAYEWKLAAAPDNKLELLVPDGSNYEFVPLSGGRYASPKGMNATLVDASGGGHELLTPQRTKYLFNADGLLASITDANNNALAFAYAAGSLQSATTNGASISLTYNAEGQLIGVTDHANRQVQYGYDTSTHDMTSITDVMGKVTQFGYDANHRVTSVKYPGNGATVQIQYDDYGRVTSYTDEYGATSTAQYVGRVAPVTRQDNSGEAPPPTLPSGPVNINPGNGHDIPESDELLLSGSMNNQRNAPPYKHVDGLKPVIGAYIEQSIAAIDQKMSAYAQTARTCSGCEADGVQAAIQASGDNPVVVRTGQLNVQRDVVFGSPTKSVVVIADGMNTNEPINVTIYGTLIINNSLNANTKLNLRAIRTGSIEGGIWVKGPIHLNNDSDLQVDDTLYGGSLTYNSGLLTVNSKRVLVKGDLSINTKVDMNIAEEMTLGGIVSNNQAANLNVVGGDLFVRDNVSVNNNLDVKTGGVFAVGGDFTPNQKPAVRTGIGDGRSILTYPASVAMEARSKEDRVQALALRTSMQQSDQTVMTDAMQAATTYYWNPQFLVQSIRYADGHRTEYAYDDDQRLVRAADGVGNVRRTSFDERGNVVQAIDGMNESMVLRYNGYNKPSEVIDASGGKTSYAHDLAGNVIKIIDSLSNPYQIARDSAGVPVKVTDANGQETVLANDTFGFSRQISDPAGYTRELVRDSLHRVTDMQDQQGAIQHTEYDAKGRIVLNEDALHQTRTLVFDDRGNLASVADEAGRRTAFQYQVDRLIGSTDAEQHTEQYTLNTLGLITDQIDKNGGTTTYEYDEMRRLVKITDPDHFLTTMTYDAAGNLLTRKDAKGAITSYTYNGRNQLLTVTDPLGAVTRYSYDAKGQLSKVTNALGAITWYDYDSLGRRIAVTDALKQQTTYSYDANGKLVAVRKPNGGEWRTTYDERGLLSGTIDPLGHETHVERDLRGNVRVATDEAGKSTRYVYDDLGRIQLIQNALGFETSYEYASTGQVQAIEDANHHRTTYGYDNEGRLVSVTNADGDTTSYAYDPLGNLLKQTDALQRETKYTYNSRNLVMEKLNALQQATSMAYDELGQLTAHTSPDGQATSYAYDAAGRLTGILYADQQRVDYSYDLLDRRVSMTDAGGTTAYSYDAMNRLSEVTDAQRQTIHYEWTATGQRSRITYPDNRAATYAYDELDRMQTVTDVNGLVTQYNYTDRGQLATKTMLTTGKSQYAYDDAGQLTQLTHTNPAGQLLEQLSYAYDPAGNIAQMKHTEQGADEDNLSGASRVTQTDYTYDALNQLTQASKLNGSATSYSYDPVGNRLGKTVVGGADSGIETYTYDAVNKLTNWAKGNDYKKYTYDLRGNLQKVEGVDSTVAALNAMLTPLSVSNQVYSGGNIAQDVYGGAPSASTPSNLFETQSSAPQLQASSDPRTLEQLSWDAANRLISHTNPAGDVSRYQYDGDNNRVKMTIDLNTGAVQETYPTGHPAGSREGWEPQYKKKQLSYAYTLDVSANLPEVLQVRENDANEAKETYTYGANGERISMSYKPTEDANNGWEPMPGASRISGPAAPKTLFYLTDALGSGLGLMASDGSIAARYHYDEFGVLAAPSKHDPNWPGPDNLYGYTGLGYDSYDGMTYARARYYKPEIGRFISEDSNEGKLDNPLSLNLYTYVQNNPLTHVDPTGHMDVDSGNGGGISCGCIRNVRDMSPEELAYYLHDPNTPQSSKDQISAYILVSIISPDKGGVSTAAKAAKNVGKQAFVDAWDAVKSLVKGCNCFAPGTKVQTDEGEKNIEDIQVGDRVLSKDEETGEVAYKEVTATFNHETDEIYKIHVGDQVIESTFNHPFWVDGKGWTFVKDLKVGDLLVQSDGNTLKIDSIELEHKHVTVYNMTVDDFHTYFVSNLGIWVHNTNCFTNIGVNSSELWNRYEGHIFSQDHIKNGIMDLGADRESIFNSIVSTISSIDKTKIKAGSNELRTTLNGAQATIRFFVDNDGTVQSINAFKGASERVVGNLIQP